MNRFEQKSMSFGRKLVYLLPILVIIPIRGRMTDNRIKPTITDRIMTRVGSRMAMMDCSLRLVFSS